MNKWVYRLERRFGRICIQNLMLVIIVGQAMVYLATVLTPGLGLVSQLSLSWPAVMRGQVWRLLTFVFIPEMFQPFGLLLSLYFYYLVGHTLEQTWGDFRFNVYYLLGMVGAIVSAVITGSASSYYLNLSLFFAFATLYPDFQVLVLFILPVKMKYLGLLSAALCIINFLFGSWATKASVLFALANFLLFFGGDFIALARREWMYYKNRRNWRRGGW